MTTYRWSFEEDVAQYRAAGIEAIGVWRQKLADFGEAKGIELLAESGLAVSNLLWAGGFTGSDGHIYHESLDDAREALQLAAALGTRHLVVYSGSRNGHTQNHARRLFASALCRAAAAGGRVGRRADRRADASRLRRRLDLSDVPGRGAGAGCTSFDSPYVKLAFDTYHLGHDPDIVQRIERAGPATSASCTWATGRCVPDREQNRHRAGRRHRAAGVHRPGTAAGRLRRILRRRADRRGDRAQRLRPTARMLEASLRTVADRLRLRWARALSAPCQNTRFIPFSAATRYASAIVG